MLVRRLGGEGGLGSRCERGGSLIGATCLEKTCLEASSGLELPAPIVELGVKLREAALSPEAPMRRH